MKLSDFVKLSREEMLNYVKSYNMALITEKDCKPSIRISGRKEYYAEYLPYDIWSTPNTFGIEADDCDWEIVPQILGSFTCAADKSLKESIKEIYDRSLLLKKKSKHGEIMFVNIDRYQEEASIHICNMRNGNNHPYVVIEGEMPKYFNGLPFKFDNSFHRDDKTEDYNNKHKNEPFKKYVIYPYIAGDISLDDYAKEVEAFAKFVSEHKDWYDIEFAKDETKENVGGLTNWLEKDVEKPEIASFISYMSLKYANPEIEFKDYANAYKVVKSQSIEVIDFIINCQKAFNGKYPIETKAYSFSMKDSPLCVSSFEYKYIGKTLSTPNLCIFACMLKDVEKFRKIVETSFDVEKLKDAAIEEYNSLLKSLSNSYGKELAMTYKKIAKTLTEIEQNYNSKFNEINAAIRSKYKEVSMDYILKYDNPITLAKSLKKNLSFISMESGNIYNSEAFNKIMNLNKVPANFKKHMAKAFEVDPDLDYIIMSSLYKCEDSPYHVRISDRFEENNMDLVEKMEKAWGKKATTKWLDKFDTFDFSDMLTEDTGHDVYPGCSIDFVFTNDLDFDYIESSNY